ncbi:amidohydrolase [Anopheles sinensis]|uniref:Amidohydrolase n=1 Tax=Anopheles sinensis TaxID=74873 RepID=A0A084VEA8_ANOSI|nr:amidohydrolase [Anopheles sinensis]
MRTKREELESFVRPARSSWRAGHPIFGFTVSMIAARTKHGHTTGSQSDLFVLEFASPGEKERRGENPKRIWREPKACETGKLTD